MVDDGSSLARALTSAVRRIGFLPVVLAAAPPAAELLPAPMIPVDFHDAPAVEAALARVRELNGSLRGVVFAHGSPAPASDVQEAITGALTRLDVAIAVARGLSLSGADSAGFLYFVTTSGGEPGHQSGGGADPLTPALEGLCHPLSLELPHTSVRAIHVDPQTGPDALAGYLRRELDEPDQLPSTTFMWRGDQRTTLGFRAAPPSESPGEISDDTIVVFAGGARGIGAVCARALARQAHCRIHLLGRKPLGEEAYALSEATAGERQAQMTPFLRAYQASQPDAPPRAGRDAWRVRLQAAEACTTLRDLRARGASAEYHAVDVRDPDAVDATLGAIYARYGRIDAIVHVAGLGGVETDRLLARKEWPVIRQLIETKAVGAGNLLRAATRLAVPRYIAFGSVASHFGNRGQVDYAAANGLLSGIVRAQNATGALPRARVIHWGAWDGIGMAATGSTKAALEAAGVSFLSPDDGARAFIRQLGADRHASDEVFITAEWPGLAALVEPNAGAAEDEHVAEFWLDPRSNPLLNHHRYHGTAWVPAALGMELAVQVASQAVPHLVACGVRNVTLRKAARLVRDEPLLVHASARLATSEAGGDGPGMAGERFVHVTLSPQNAQQSWVFAEMDVVMAPAHPAVLADEDPAGARARPGAATDVRELTRADLYPSKWLPFQQHGTTYQVIDELTLWPGNRRIDARLYAGDQTPKSRVPVTLIDGLLQVFGAGSSIAQGHWSGPPLEIGEVRWRADAVAVRGELSCTLRLDGAPGRSPSWQLRDSSGRCLVSMYRVEHGGVNVQALRDRLARPSAGLDTVTEGRAVAPLPRAVPAQTPYLGTVLETQSHRRLRAAQTLDPVSDPLLRDHQFNQYVLVPAVYYLEIAVEASAHLSPDLPPTELRDARFHRALTLVRERKTLLTEAEVVEEADVARHLRVRFYTRREGTLTLHAECVVVHAPAPPAMPAVHEAAWPPNAVVDTRAREQVYPHRFPNGPIFQVIDRMELAGSHASRSRLRRQAPPRPGAWLPLTLLDGAFQVDSATRSGFDRPSGLPQAFDRLRWEPGAAALAEVVCLSEVGSSSTEARGSLAFLDEARRVVLHLQGLTLTAAFRSLWKAGAA